MNDRVCLGCLQTLSGPLDQHVLTECPARITFSRDDGMAGTRVEIREDGLYVVLHPRDGTHVHQKLRSRIEIDTDWVYFVDTRPKE